MQTISDVMTRTVHRVAPGDTVRRAAQMMNQFDVGSIPVCDGDQLVGMITDRDITVRATAAGRVAEQTKVSDVMSKQVRTCYSNQGVDEVIDQMGDVKIRRVPVLDQKSQRLVGIVSLGDMASVHAPGIEHALEVICEHATPDRPRAH
jgi:CBS domain-containing protein